MGQVPPHNSGITVGLIGADMGGGGDRGVGGEAPKALCTNYGHK